MFKTIKFLYFESGEKGILDFKKSIGKNGVKILKTKLYAIKP